MGVQRSNRHKRTKTGAKKGIHRKKRKFALTRPASNTKIGEQRIREIRTRGGNSKDRALRLNSGNFAILTEPKQSENQNKNIQKFDVNAFTSFESKIMQVMYHPTNTELMRTNTLTKGSIVKIEGEIIDHLRSLNLSHDKVFSEYLKANCVYGVICSRPGQDGNADGYVLMGEELKFYSERFKKGKK